MVVLGGWAFSYERGTPVEAKTFIDIAHVQMGEKRRFLCRYSVSFVGSTEGDL